MALFAKVRLAVRAVRLKLHLLTAYDTFWPAALRGGKLLLRGRVGTFTQKLFNELPDARDAEPVEARRAGPPLFLAGHVLGLGGYDHLVLNILKGLTECGVNVCRDRRSCFRKQLVPVELRPTEKRRERGQGRALGPHRPAAALALAQLHGERGDFRLVGGQGAVEEVCGEVVHGVAGLPANAILLCRCASYVQRRPPPINADKRR